MNPYEKTSEEMKRQSEGPKSFAKAALGSLGAIGAASFSPILARAAPFLSEYIPENLAIKGLSKVNQKLGSFVQQAMDKGYDFKEVKDFLGNQISQSQPAKDDKNIIQQYSPELHEFISQQVSGGRSPIEAGAIAQNDKRFGDAIKKLTKDHKTPWSSIIQSVYGSEGVQKSQNAQQQQPSQQGQPEQAGQGQQALMAILDKINQKLGQ
jgi:hypothetical protein